MIGGVILAAGAGRRFGGPKQLAPLAGRPLLEHVIASMVAVPALERSIVVLGAYADEIAKGVDFRDAEPVLCHGWEEGMAASLRCGIEALAGADAVVVTLGDQPFITPRAIEAVLDGIASRAAATRATYAGAPGHPVLIKRALFPAIAELRGDVGARQVLDAVGVRECELGHLGRADDIDTPEQLEALIR